ncbi:unnamed protein product [Toxocara canis]|uniref:Secreted protein n=1 Tax=Toxocara canis TaxID=6265 RepID=A0A183UJK7_TOXCA|nr:unnamed protein product [Toxocara canis]
MFGYRYTLVVQFCMLSGGVGVLEAVHALSLCYVSSTLEKGANWPISIYWLIDAFEQHNREPSRAEPRHS